MGNGLVRTFYGKMWVLKPPKYADIILFNEK